MHICTNSWRSTSPLAFSFWCDTFQSWQVELGSAVLQLHSACLPAQLLFCPECNLWLLTAGTEIKDGEVKLAMLAFPCPCVHLMLLRQTWDIFRKLDTAMTKKDLSARRTEFQKWWAVPRGRSGQSPPFTLTEKDSKPATKRWSKTLPL